MKLKIRKVGQFVEIKTEHSNGVFDLGLYDKEEAREFISEIQNACYDIQEWINEK